MHEAYLWFAAGLILLMVAGLWRVLRGPTSADRMLAVQLFSTLGVGAILLLARAKEDPHLLDVALLIAVLSAVFSAAFSRHAPQLMPKPPKKEQ